MQNSSSSAGRQALADFLGSMVTQKAHWYSLAVDSNDPDNAELSIIFPTLSSLLSIEHETMPPCPTKKGETIIDAGCMVAFHS